jgi:broad specificity phosphatase PhoE
MRRTVSTGFQHKNKLRLPKRILLVRHGESLGNVDEEAYHTIPDWLIPITERGQEQAKATGQKIKAIIGDEPVYLYYSPYLRTRQTMVAMMESLKDNPVYGVREEPRITEQQFGNFQNNEMENFKKEKSKFGNFYYRFPEGESGLDVYNRVTSFIGSLFREWYSHSTDDEFSNTNVIIVTHGLSLRLFIMRWFHFTVHQFEESINPKNGEIIIMERVSKNKNLKNGFMSESFIADKSPDRSKHQEGLNGTFCESFEKGDPMAIAEDEAEEYLLDLHPVSSYEQLELTEDPQIKGSFSSTSSQPSLFIYPYRQNSHMTSSVQENYECFVLTKSSQEAMNFHLPKKSKSMEHAKYFSWADFNHIFHINEEIQKDIDVIKKCPKLMEELAEKHVTLVEMKEEIENVDQSDKK